MAFHGRVAVVFGGGSGMGRIAARRLADQGAEVAICDISETGIAISVPHKFNGHKPTKEVELLLTLHGQGTVRAKGAIRHVSYTRTDTATFGVELVAIDELDRAKIREYVAAIQEGVPTPIGDDDDRRDED